MASALLTPSFAHAIPAFARKYDTSCNTCHAHVYPEINPYGRFFKENGYQLARGAEKQFRDRTTQEPGAVNARLDVFRSLPLAMRVVSTVQIPTDAVASERNSVDFRMISDLFVLAGGSVYRDISFFAAASLEPNPFLHHASIGFHNLIGGEGAMNLRAGQFLLLDFLRNDHRTLTRQGSLGATTRVGQNPTVLDTNHFGFDLYGRVLRRQLFYEAAIVQGAQGDDGIDDLDSNKDLFAQAQYFFGDEQMIGGLAYRGRTQILDTSQSTEVRFTDPFWIVGPTAEMHRGPLTFFGYALYNVHDNPTGFDEEIGFMGYRAQVDAAFTRNVLAILRYDRVESEDDFTLEREVLTTHLTYLRLMNLKMSAEYNADLMDFDLSTVSLRLDLAI